VSRAGRWPSAEEAVLQALQSTTRREATRRVKPNSLRSASAQFTPVVTVPVSAAVGLTVERVGSLESKDATRTRVKWYVSFALFNTLKLAKLVGIRP
jgi:hypothetical protein